MSRTERSQSVSGIEQSKIRIVAGLEKGTSERSGKGAVEKEGRTERGQEKKKCV